MWTNAFHRYLMCLCVSASVYFNVWYFAKYNFVHPSYSDAPCAYNKYTLIYHYYYYCYYLSIRIVSLLRFQLCWYAVENEKEIKFETSQAVCNQTFKKWNENNNNIHSICPLSSHTISFLFHYFTSSTSISPMVMIVMQACVHIGGKTNWTPHTPTHRRQRTHTHTQTPNHSTPLINYVIFVIKYIIYNNALISCRHYLWNFSGNSPTSVCLCCFR